MKFSESKVTDRWSEQAAYRQAAIRAFIDAKRAFSRIGETEIMAGTALPRRFAGMAIGKMRLITRNSVNPKI